MPIFQKSVIKKYLAGIDREQIENAYQIFQKNYSPEKTEIIRKLKEEEYQDGFLRDIFADVLGYTLKPDAGFNLVREFKNPCDSRKADGAVLKNDKAVAVIELKSAKTKDLKSVAEQAFNYKNSQPECKYVITSNFQKLRFYIDYANEYEEFDLFRLDRQDFELLFLLLCKQSIFNDIPEKLKKESVSHEESVSKKLYTDYSVFRKKLFENLTANNQDIDRFTLLGKAQKLIDRFLFILFAEDKGLLPPNSINRIIERFHTLRQEDAYKPLYEICKQYFGYMNTGRTGKRTADDIPAYNGGLFYPDEVLYDLKIDDDILIDDLQKLSAYDFDTEVDVNILGHIFEHSLSEIEETTARIKGTDIDKTKTRRKKHGIFYTPPYITQYIVENTIGKLCGEKRKELDIDEIEADDSFYTKKGGLSKKGNVLYQKMEEYKNWLLSLKILDPACGSGAFLNQALHFLIREHHFIIEMQTDLKKGQVSVFSIETAVLENNLYGVDMNEESVEITKLSLWLHTAHKKRKLSNLSNNIRCGNSLTYDPEIAGEKAFQWEKEFPEIMQNGGFDVVIGNPPYVRQELLGATVKSFYLKKYPEVYNRIADLYVYFYALSIKILKVEGLLGFITSNKWMERKYGYELRIFLKQYELIEIINFGELKIFADASAEPAIIILKNKKTDHAIKYACVKSMEESFQTPYKTDIFKKEALNDEIWRFTDPLISSVLKKFNSGNKTLDEYTEGGVCYGIKTGLNKAFIIDSETRDKIVKKDPKSSEILKKMVEGDDFEGWLLVHSGRYMVATQYDLDVPNEYPAVYEYLKPFEKELVKRQDKGVNYWNLRSCDYYEKLDKPKIIYYHTAVKHSFYLDREGYYISANCYFIANADTYLQCILNSKFFHFVKKYLFPAFGDAENKGRVRLDANKMVKLPIKSVSPEDQQPFIEKADIMLSQNRELHKRKTDFFNFFKSELKPQKINKKLEKWNELDWEQFKQEMEKCKVRELSLKERRQWQDYFIENKEKADKIKSVIDSTDKEIDQMVYELYGLTPEEIKTVEKTSAER